MINYKKSSQKDFSTRKANKVNHFWTQGLVLIWDSKTNCMAAQNDHAGIKIFNSLFELSIFQRWEVTAYKSPYLLNPAALCSASLWHQQQTSLSVILPIQTVFDCHHQVEGHESDRFLNEVLLKFILNFNARTQCDFGPQSLFPLQIKYVVINLKKISSLLHWSAYKTGSDFCCNLLE